MVKKRKVGKYHAHYMKYREYYLHGRKSGTKKKHRKKSWLFR
jgi:hypothetical protein